MLSFRKIILLFLLFVPSFLDMVSCSNTTYYVQIYDFDGTNYSLEVNDVRGRYEKYTFNQDIKKLEGYKFLGYICIDRAFKDDEAPKTIKDLETLLENGYYSTIYNLPEEHSVPGDVTFFPLYVKTEELDTFLATSPLAKMEVVIRYYLGNISSNAKEVKVTALITDTYEDIINGLVEVDGYKFVGIGTVVDSNIFNNPSNSPYIVDQSELFISQNIFSSRLILLYYLPVESN